MNSPSGERLLGIDLGGTAVKAGALDPSGKVLQRETEPLPPAADLECIVRTIAGLIRKLDPGQRGFGLGTPGLIDRSRGVIMESPNIESLQDCSLSAELAATLEIAPELIRVENDANVAALGEQWLGAGRGQKDVMVLTLGTGIGSGLILDGELFTGPGGMAAEIGHILVDPAGPLCGCGAHGCLESLASASAAERRARKAGLEGDLATIATRARASAGAERELMEAVGFDLGRGIASVVSLLDLRLFVVGGGFSAAFDVLEPGIKRGLRERIRGARVDSIEVRPAGLGPDAGWIGAARLTLPGC